MSLTSQTQMEQAGSSFAAPANNALLPPVAAPRKDPNYASMARLASLPPAGYTSDDSKGKIVIYLPYLPENLEFPRENTYQARESNQAMPDGFWIYQSTSPLEINLEFTLHYTDDLCIEGSKTLLEIAAKFHALMLPASNSVARKTNSPPAISTSDSASSIELNDSTTQLSASDAARNISAQLNVKFPPACSLRLIQAGSGGLGVNCVGFIKSAVPILHGPYMQSTDGGAYNLPSAATYKFTFVHNPSYTNYFANGEIKFINAFGPDVFNFFYNTAHLSALTGETYSDIEDLDQTTSAPGT